MIPVLAIIAQMRRQALLLLLCHLNAISLAALAHVALLPLQHPWDFSRSRRRLLTSLPVLLSARELRGVFRPPRRARRCWSYRATVSLNASKALERGCWAWDRQAVDARKRLAWRRGGASSTVAGMVVLKAGKQRCAVGGQGNKALARKLANTSRHREHDPEHGPEQGGGEGCWPTRPNTGRTRGVGPNTPHM